MNFSKFLAGLLGLASTVTSGFCAVDVSSVALDVSPIETIAVTMLGALGVIWVARQVINFLR